MNRRLWQFMSLTHCSLLCGSEFSDWPRQPAAGTSERGEQHAAGCVCTGAGLPGASARITLAMSTGMPSCPGAVLVATCADKSRARRPTCRLGAGRRGTLCRHGCINGDRVSVPSATFFWGRIGAVRPPRVLPFCGGVEAENCLSNRMVLSSGVCVCLW